MGFLHRVYAQSDLIPMPQKVSWSDGTLDLRQGITLEGDTTGMDRELHLLSEVMKANRLPFSYAKNGSTPYSTTLNLTLSALNTRDKKESYRLVISATGITVSASTKSGLYYGLQTLKQLITAQGTVPFCSIEDEPAFPWRAFLVDVGRNYQPLEMLKEQIDIMAQYKLNVLHFHFTEDIAWRLNSKRYPGLTDSTNMTRWAGKSYTEQEFRELIKYCSDRHITFLPEIDMPGHSAAFHRFFGVDMQSDAGMVFLKELLHEFANTYPGLPYLHIGGDEVKITNPNFMEEMTRYIESLGFKTLGWDPGGNLMQQTIHQLWMGGPKPIEPHGALIYIDSKHLYINHMDPLETVTTLFYRQIGEQKKAHKNLWGATLCVWPDRAVSAPEDMFLQNAIYPAMLTFAERIWQGGGLPGWKANIHPPEQEENLSFASFEKRLLQHKDKFFKNLPFPYVKHTDIAWELIGPFPNEGKLTQAFSIEKQPLDPTIVPTYHLTGGTVILRHWWTDVIQGALASPQTNTTWYARTKIWSDSTGYQPFWIGFGNLSRSYASDSPSQGTWDNLHSAIQVNGKWIEPPIWKQPGLKGNLEKPLRDEGYTFREPQQIYLNKGWNHVLIKLPMGSFAGRSWDNPNKWMFTFVPYR